MSFQGERKHKLILSCERETEKVIQFEMYNAYRFASENQYLFPIIPEITTFDSWCFCPLKILVKTREFIFLLFLFLIEKFCFISLKFKQSYITALDNIY